MTKEGMWKEASLYLWEEVYLRLIGAVSSWPCGHSPHPHNTGLDLNTTVARLKIQLGVDLIKKDSLLGKTMQIT